MGFLKSGSVIIILFLVGSNTQAQSFTWGPRGGISTPDIKPDDVNPLKINNIRDSLTLKLSDANYGWNVGLFARLQIAKFYIQPEVVFNSTSANYTSKSLRLGTIIDSARSETYRNVDVPLLLGFKSGALRLNAGPVGHIHLSSTSDIINISGYSQNFQKLEWGYQAGLGLDFGALNLDLRYEGNFNDYGDHITFGNTTYAFSKMPSRMILSFGIAF